MNKYSPYWILNPLENNITIRSYKNWSFYTSEEVISGKSPLTDLGNKFYHISNNYSSLYNHCLWIFNNSEFDSENSYKLSSVFKSVSETFCNSFLSQMGIIVRHPNQNITKQPAAPKHYESIAKESLTNDKLIRIAIARNCIPCPQSKSTHKKNPNLSIGISISNYFVNNNSLYFVSVQSSSSTSNSNLSAW